jgi:hypothetical protein
MDTLLSSKELVYSTFWKRKNNLATRDKSDEELG